MYELIKFPHIQEDIVKSLAKSSSKQGKGIIIGERTKTPCKVQNIDRSKTITKKYSSVETTLIGNKFAYNTPHLL